MPEIPERDGPPAAPCSPYEAVIDPDCRDGKCSSCVGGPCEHECHQPSGEAPAAETVTLPPDVPAGRVKPCGNTLPHGSHWWPSPSVRRWCAGADENGLREIALPEAPAADPEAPHCPRCGEGCLVAAQLGGPEAYSCGHRGLLADLHAGGVVFREPATPPGRSADPEALWTVSVTVPLRLGEAMLDGLFTAVADAVHEWEPDDRDGWDAEVSGGAEYATNSSGSLTSSPGRSADEIRAAINATVAQLSMTAGQDEITDAVMEIVGPLIAERDDQNERLMIKSRYAEYYRAEADEQRQRADERTKDLEAVNAELWRAVQDHNAERQRAERAENNEQATRNAFNAQADLLERTAAERDRLREADARVRELAKGWIARGESAAMPSPFVARGREVLAALDGTDGGETGE